MALAWALASVVSDDVVRLIIGVIGVVFVLNVWFGKMPPPGRPSALSGVFWGAGVGVHLDDRVGRHAAIRRSTCCRSAWTRCSSSAPSRCSSRSMNWLRIIPYFALGQLTRENLTISAVLLPLAIAFNFLGFWLVQRIPTEPFYRIAYTLMFLISPH